jgi:hypothetical protein
MFEVILGQEGDDYVGSSRRNLTEAIKDAEMFLKQLGENKLGTYIYISTPEGTRLNPPWIIKE